VEKREALKDLTIKETIAIALWSVRLMFQIDKAKTIWYVLFDVITRLQSIINTYLIAQVFNQLVTLMQKPNSQITDMLPIMLVLLGYNVISALIWFFDRYTDESLRAQIDTKMDKIFYSKLQTLGISALEDPEVNNRINRARGRVYGIQNYFAQVIRLFGVSISLVTNTILIAKFAPIIIPIIFIAVLPSRLVDKKYRKLLWKFTWENTERSRVAGETAYELSSARSLPEIMINKATAFLDKKYMDFSTWYNRESMQIKKKWYIGSNGLSILQEIGIYTGYLIVFGNALKKIINMGDVYFQTSIIQRLNGDLGSIITTTNQLFEHSIRMNEAYLLFQMPEENVKGNIKLPKLDRGPTIEFKNLTFSYPNSDKKIINNLNLKIESGEKVSIVGINGAGKTTLMKLLCNIYEPTGGDILINGHSLKDIENSTWYENLGVLFQEYNKYAQLTVKENIIIGNPNIRFHSKRMIEAAQNADAFEFIQQFPNKFDQILSQNYEKGIRPSTGQWQKIAIARFFYRDAPMIIFDEPTAAIDAVSEYNIFNKIYRFFKRKTVILISHRFSTVRNADRILVLDGGKIIEDGTHEKLMKLDGKYAHSFNLQAEGYK